MTCERTDWNTPANVLEVVNAIDEIGLDPCSNPNSIVKAKTTYTLPKQDGLRRPWTRRGLVYVNPPYGREIVAWMRRCQQQAARGVEIVALVPVRADTRWWHTYCVPPKADAVCFWQGRLRFLGAPTCAPFSSALVYWGPRRPAFLRAASKVGALWYINTK